MRAVAAAAALWVVATSVAAAQVASPALFDPTLTVGAGATLSTTAGSALARAADLVIPHRLFEERGAPRRATNFTFRLFKLAYVDAPQERLLLVVNHELFGHGARLRERFDGPIAYEIGVPSPYGRGGGSTSFVLTRTPTDHELMTVYAGGMEASSVGAALVADRAFSAGTMRPREALRYLAFELDTFSYVLSTSADSDGAGHDVAEFLAVYNALAAGVAAPQLTRRALRREALGSLANPMLAFAAYGIGRYLADGSTDVAVPALSIAGVRYLPMLRYRLAPYGTEWSMVNYFGGRMRPTEIELRVGRAPQGTPWGVRMRQRDVAAWRAWKLEASVDVWRQPRIALAAADPVAVAPRTGVYVRGRLERPLAPVWFSADRATLIVDIGGKSAGFVPGEPLRGGVVVRGGMGVPLGP